METDSSQKTESSQTHVYAFIEGRIARYDGLRLLTQARLHCACDGVSQLQHAPPAARQRTKTVCD